MTEQPNHAPASESLEQRAAQLLQAGLAHYSRREYVAALASFRGALELRPDWPEAHHNVGRALFYLGQVERALDHFGQAAEHSDSPRPGAAIALLIPGDPRADNQAILDARRASAQRWLPPTATRRAPAQIAGRPLRVGYISSFFQDRNWMKPVWGLINQHDRSRFELHLFSEAPLSKLQPSYQALPQDHFHDITKLSNESLSQLIRDANLDLLIDLNGYSDQLRLPVFTTRPAGLLVGWFNMYATTGIDAYDYLIGDHVVIPPQEECFYSEKIVRVPGSYLTFDISYPVPPVADPPCLSTGAITFGSLASLYKINDEVIRAWSSILQQVPGSSLLLKSRGLASPETRQFVLDLFAQRDVSPTRIRLEGPSDHVAFLQTYDKVDIALDTFPYNGGTTTTEAIWQGVPVVTFFGDRWVSRTSASLLRAGTLGNFVAPDLAGYISLAVRLANAPEALLEHRRSMRSRLQASPVCDTHTFARNMERLYLQMINGQCDATTHTTAL